ncbi:natural killer cells antigen CD94 isoform X2 [Boleophthalmus pectinirostris]|uniref:natural killer cells antigen CD94 isoform X2 n=1 Tax=Boleophthalmus pectinirostris TaxID=150288 RepID=UPI00242F9436|nr:natural killer cells antigen CD94 isoform X2 [Boleophthalmus pectinirostris]
MEMEAITTEPDSGEGTSEPKAKTEEEAETDLYSKLNSPSEDLYAEAKYLSDPSKKKKVVQGAWLWKGGCVCLGALCLILLLVVIVLALKRQQERPCEVNIPKPPFVNKPPFSRQRCQSSVCDDGWLYSSRYCFLFSPERKTWEDSRQFCEKKGGMLAVITNPDLQTFLTKNAAVQYWIGLSYKDGRWSWVNGQDLEGNFWLDSNPGTGNCAMLFGVRNNKTENNWGKNLCTRPKYCICQKPMKD